MPDRREFLDTALLAGLGAVCAVPVRAAAISAGYQPRTLGASELATLIAVMARLIPADGEGGGAVEAGAHIYVDQALTGYLAPHRPSYRSGLEALEAASRIAGAEGFATASVATQDALLTRMEGGALDAALADGGREFFTLVRRHTLEGLLCDPMYGGNRNFLGWELIGFHGVMLFYSVQAQAIGGKHAAGHRSIASYGGHVEL
jgi:gluconate 2-dehydrogenase gamma chain